MNLKKIAQAAVGRWLGQQRARQNATAPVSRTDTVPSARVETVPPRRQTASTNRTQAPATTEAEERNGNAPATRKPLSLSRPRKITGFRPLRKEASRPCRLPGSRNAAAHRHGLAEGLPPLRPPLERNGLVNTADKIPPEKELKSGFYS